MPDEHTTISRLRLAFICMEAGSRTCEFCTSRQGPSPSSVFARALPPPIPPPALSELCWLTLRHGTPAMPLMQAHLFEVYCQLCAVSLHFEGSTAGTKVPTTLTGLPLPRPLFFVPLAPARRPLPVGRDSSSFPAAHVDNCAPGTGVSSSRHQCHPATRAPQAHPIEGFHRVGSPGVLGDGAPSAASLRVVCCKPWDCRHRFTYGSITAVIRAQEFCLDLRTALCCDGAFVVDMN